MDSFRFVCEYSQTLVVQSYRVMFDVISHMPKRASAFQPLVSPEKLLTHPNLFIYGQVSSVSSQVVCTPFFNPENVASMHLHLPGFKNVCEYSQTWPKTEETAFLRRILKSAQKAKKWTLAILLHHFFCALLQLLSGHPVFRTQKRLRIRLFFIFFARCSFGRLRVR